MQLRRCSLKADPALEVQVIPPRCELGGGPTLPTWPDDKCYKSMMAWTR